MFVIHKALFFELSSDANFCTADVSINLLIGYSLQPRN